MEHLEWIRPPLQERSQQTLARIVAAAEALIIEKGVENVTMVEIARRANSSVGSMYARFPDKDALFRSVFERFFDEAVATTRAALDPERWRGQPTATLVRSGIAFVVYIFRERRRLIAGFATHAAAAPELATLSERIASIIADAVLDVFAARNDRIDHPDPTLAVHTVIWLILSALEARTLHSFDNKGQISDDTLVAELTRLCLSYLQPNVTSTANDQRGGNHGLGRIR